MLLVFPCNKYKQRQHGTVTVEAPVQRINGWSVLKDSSESTLPTLCALFFIMSPYGCPGYPDDGVYYISTHNLWVGDEEVSGVDNIVINNHKTVGLSILSD